MRWKYEYKKKNDRYIWRKWFAWHPVLLLRNYENVWLEYVMRIKVTDLQDVKYLYKEIGDEEYVDMMTHDNKIRRF